MAVWKRIVTVLGSLLLLMYVGYQAYLTLYMPVKTQRAAMQTVEDGIPAVGYVVNSETVITANVDGVLDYELDDGERVAKGGTVANVYATAQQAQNERQLHELDSEIKGLQAENLTGSNMAIDIDVLDAEITQKFSALCTQANSASVVGITQDKTDLVGLLNEKQLATGKASNFNARLSALNAERQKLAAADSGAAAAVTSPVSGYFVSRVDGYEGRFPASGVMSVTTKQVNALLAAKPAVQKNAVGKVISSYEWYMLCVLDTADAQKLKLGGNVGLSIPFSDNSSIPATVAAVNRDSAGKCAVVFQCNSMSGSIATLRNSSISIVVGRYTGIRVDNADVRVENGVRGVYVLEGNTARFRSVDVAYAGDGFLISKIDSTDANRLQLYDDIVVEGRDIYDGKIVK